MVDVVNEDGEPVGTAFRGRVHEEGLLHLAVHVLLFEEGRVLLQRRSGSKRTYAGSWTSSASGHVVAGEAPLAAARREVEEELGVASPLLSWLGRVRFEDERVGERELTHVFMGDGGGLVLDPDPSEVEETWWVPCERLSSLVEEDRDRFAASFLPVWAFALDRLVRPEEGA